MNRRHRRKGIPIEKLEAKQGVPDQPADSTQRSALSQQRRRAQMRGQGANPNRAPWLEDDVARRGRKLVKGIGGHRVNLDNVEKAPPLFGKPIPSDAPNYLENEADRSMAEQQAKIDGMQPVEMDAQEKWAQSQLEKFVRGFCVMGATFMRVRGGYRCMEFGHLVTDKLIRKGRAVCYLMGEGSTRENPVWEGPFYGKEVWEHRYGPGATGPLSPLGGMRGGSGRGKLRGRMGRG